VLSIAAAKLGFEPVWAVDVDDAAVEATVENARVNRVELAARRADAFVDELPQVDVVLANVALDVVERLLPRFDGRIAVTSGYLAGQQPDAAAWRPRHHREADGWRADVLERA
jgi:ribosomal protein L11 methyltransferase